MGNSLKSGASSAATALLVAAAALVMAGFSCEDEEYGGRGAGGSAYGGSYGGFGGFGGLFGGDTDTPLHRACHAVCDRQAAGVDCIELVVERWPDACRRSCDAAISLLAEECHDAARAAYDCHRFIVYRCEEPTFSIPLAEDSSACEEPDRALASCSTGDQPDPP